MVASSGRSKKWGRSGPNGGRGRPEAATLGAWAQHMAAIIASLEDTAELPHAWRTSYLLKEERAEQEAEEDAGDLETHPIYRGFNRPSQETPIPWQSLNHPVPSPAQCSLASPTADRLEYLLPPLAHEPVCH